MSNSGYVTDNGQYIDPEPIVPYYVSPEKIDRETFFRISVYLESIGWQFSSTKITNGWKRHFIQEKQEVPLQIGRISILWKNVEVQEFYLKFYGEKFGLFEHDHKLQDAQIIQFNIHRICAGKEPVSVETIKQVEQNYIIRETNRVQAFREKFNKPSKKYKFRSKYKHMLRELMEIPNDT